MLPPSRSELTQRFSLQFCQTFMSAELAGKEVRYVQEDVSTCGYIRDCCTGTETVIIMGSLVVACRGSLVAMEQAAKDSHVDIVGPLLGGGSQIEQGPSIPFAYHDTASFREASDWVLMESGSQVRRVEELAPDIFCCPGRFFTALPAELPLKQLSRHPIWAKAPKGVVEGSLAHTFSAYYSHARADLAALVPQDALLILDVGCGSGGLGSQLKAVRSSVRIVGVEPDPEAAAKAEFTYDQVHIGTVASYQADSMFDCIVCGDVLEHLEDPWRALSKFHALLKNEGYLVGSCPNVGHWTVLKGLLEGHFQYLPAGILCWDHLRHFTEDSLLHMLKGSGFQEVEVRAEKALPTPKGEAFLDVLQKAGLGSRPMLLTSGFIFTARKI